MWRPPFWIFFAFVFIVDFPVLTLLQEPPRCTCQLPAMVLKAVAVLTGSEGVSGTVTFTQDADGEDCMVYDGMSEAEIWRQ